MQHISHPVSIILVCESETEHAARMTPKDAKRSDSDFMLLLYAGSNSQMRRLQRYLSSSDGLSSTSARKKVRN